MRHYTEAVAPVRRTDSGTILIGGRPVTYELIAEDCRIPAEDGTEAFDIFTFSYIRTDGEQKDGRPVLFAFNGGPTSSSAWLHLGFYGPRILVLPEEGLPDQTLSGQLRDNAECLLNLCDIVMLDPVNTGFSRLLDEEYAGEFLGDHADAKMAAKFIRTWLQRHERQDSPVFLSGESFGSTRASLLADLLADDTDLRGIAHIGPGYSSNEEALRIFKDLPPAAATHWYYHRREEAALREVLDDCYEFLFSCYVPEMYRGGTSVLPEARQRELADRLEQLTGLPAEYYLKNELKVNRRDFRRMILADHGLKVGDFDTRFTLPLDAEGEPFMSAYGPIVDAAMDALLEETGVGKVRDYRPWSHEGDPEWDWFYSASPGIVGMLSQEISMADAARSAMEKRPEMRLFFGTGVYDTVATIENTRYSVTHTGIDMSRVELHEYESGHAVYADEPSRKQLAADIRAFIEALI